MVALIPLRAQDGEIRAYAYLDEEDAEHARHQWCLDSSTGYAVRILHLGMREGRQIRRKVYLHRVVLGLTPGDGRQADHIDGDRLNCRRGNMRVVSHAENGQNVPSGGGTSRYRGVSWQARGTGGKWQAKSQLDGRQKHVGYFDDEEDAAAAVTAFRLAHMPYSNESRSTT